MPRPVKRVLSPANPSTNNISLAQTTSGAASLLLNGSTGGALDFARNLAIASTGNLSSITFTIIGTDADGRPATETLAGPNNNTVNSVLYYLNISSIAVSAAVGTNVTVGTADQLVSQMIPLNFYHRFSYLAVVEVNGTANFTLQECFDNVLQGDLAIWDNVPNLTNITVTSSVPAVIESQGTLQATAIRLKLNSYTNGVVVTFITMQTAGTEDD